jgi:hypothetical protein
MRGVFHLATCIASPSMLEWRIARRMSRSAHDNSRLGGHGPRFRTRYLGRVPDHLRELVAALVERRGGQLSQTGTGNAVGDPFG